jgi:hypothetical protein
MYECERTGKAFRTEAEVRKSENEFPKHKIEQLRKRIASGKPWTPKVGDLVYVATHLYIDHGEDDVVGGLAQVTKVVESMSGGDRSCKFVDVAQHDSRYNWTQWLCPEQKDLMKEFGNKVAYPDPDLG